MSTPAPEKIEQFRQQLKNDWTRDETVAAWRKWHKEMAAFTRGATEALLNDANIQPGQSVLDLASGVGDPALTIASKVGPSGHVTATDVGPGMMSLAAELAAQQNLHNIQFQEAAADIRAGEFPAKPGFACKFCDYESICPAREQGAAASASGEE